MLLVLNRLGDYAIVKGRWQGFVRKVSGDKLHKGRSGAAGTLNIELFNLLRNTVQKLQLVGEWFFGLKVTLIIVNGFSRALITRRYL